MYQDLSTHHDGSVKKAIVDLPIQMKGNLKRSPGNLLSLLRAHNKVISTAWHAMQAIILGLLKKEILNQTRLVNKLLFLKSELALSQ